MANVWIAKFKSAEDEKDEPPARLKIRAASSRSKLQPKVGKFPGTMWKFVRANLGKINSDKLVQILERSKKMVDEEHESFNVFVDSNGNVRKIRGS